MMDSVMLKVGLCQGRHNIPDVEKYIFPTEVTNVNDVASLQAAASAALKALMPLTHSYKLVIYVTGLTVALIAAINAARALYVCDITVMHYDRETGGYYPQDVRW